LSGSSTTPQRYAIGIEYDGSAYKGWQIQPHAPSIQQSLNDALSRVADVRVECTGAGRTDTGVHAAAQVGHFDSSAPRSLRSWLLGINSNLPSDISVIWITPVSTDFHARFSATERSYRYTILNRPVRSALLRQRAWWVHQPLDVSRMRASANCLLGEHDFSAFRAAACQSHSAVRTINRLDIARAGERIHVDCSANAFLHHMVRNIVGSLVRVGKGEETEDWIRHTLAARDRRMSGMTAPPQGLTLTGVGYSEGLLVNTVYRGVESGDT
jgi:tRNA pseudouridine38-40 synthase